MKLALVLNAVDPRLGGVLIRGEKGTAKSTAARGLAALLPPVRVVDGCRFACDPTGASTRCAECAASRHRARPRATETRPPRSSSCRWARPRTACWARSTWSARSPGERHFEPGLLARANRGVLYVDEVNLLPDHLVDVLLDAAAMGVNVVEREGISSATRPRFVLVGTMNPEEGELRPQLLDRFALAVDVVGMPERRRAGRGRAAAHRVRGATRSGSRTRWAAEEAAERGRGSAARGRCCRGWGSRTPARADRAHLHRVRGGWPARRPRDLQGVLALAA